jgi:hypothetical protein
MQEVITAEIAEALAGYIFGDGKKVKANSLSPCPSHS